MGGGWYEYVPWFVGSWYEYVPWFMGGWYEYIPWFVGGLVRIRTMVYGGAGTNMYPWFMGEGGLVRIYTMVCEGGLVRICTMVCWGAVTNMQHGYSGTGENIISLCTLDMFILCGCVMVVAWPPTGTAHQVLMYSNCAFANIQ